MKNEIDCLSCSGDINCGKSCIILLPVSSVKTGKSARYDGTGKGIQALVRSIEKYGVKKPIYVSGLGGGCYQLITGNRRLMAAKRAGLEHIPAIVFEPEDGESLAVSALKACYSELHFLEAAESFREVLEEEGIRQRELAEKLGRSQGYIANKLRLLSLPLSVRRLIVSREIPEKAAMEILKLYDEKVQRMAVETVFEKRLSTRETAMLVATLKDKDAVLKSVYGKKLNEYEKWQKFFADGKEGGLTEIEKVRQFIKVLKELIEIARKSGVTMRAGQRNGERTIEIAIAINRPVKESVVELSGAQKAAA